MGVWDWLGSTSPAGIVGSAAKETVGAIFSGIDTLIRDFKVPPEQLVAYETAKDQLSAKLEELATQDRNNARQREMQVHDHVPAHLAYGSLGVFASLAAAVLFVDIPPSSHDIVIAMLSWVGGFVSSAFLYYFGSSVGSKNKDSLIDLLAAKK